MGVAILAASDDRLAQLVQAALEQREVPVVFLEASSPFGAAGLSWSIDSQAGFLELESSRLDLDRVRGVLFREPPGTLVDTLVGGDDRAYRAWEVHATLLGLLAALKCPVVNRPRPAEQRSFLLTHARSVRSAGLRVTPTLVTSDPRAAYEFFGACCEEGALVGSTTKWDGWDPVGGDGNSRAHGAAERVEVTQREFAQRTAREPLVLRALPRGERVTVFVVDQRTVTGARDGAGRLRAADLSAPLRAACVRLAASLSLSLALIELVAGDREATCLDVTSFPSLAECDAELEDELAMALALLLAGAPGA
jgi:hypothetical protein